MDGHSVTVDLPSPVYEDIRRAAERAHRSFADVLVEAVTAVAPVIDSAPTNLRSALAQLAYLNDAALWQVARATMAADQRERMESLHQINGQRPLTDGESIENEALLRLYRETVLVRAQAALLLKQRGIERSEPWPGRASSAIS
jgi:hypothetical protein